MEAILAIIGAYVVFLIIFYVLLVAAYWKIFAKAGEAGWKSIIPIYNEYVLYKIVWNTKMFWITLLLGIVTCVCSSIEGVFPLILSGAAGIAITVISVISLNKLAKAFGHGAGYTLGLIFLPNIFTLILGFGSDSYLGPQ